MIVDDPVTTAASTGSKPALLRDSAGTLLEINRPVASFGAIDDHGP